MRRKTCGQAYGVRRTAGARRSTPTLDGMSETLVGAWVEANGQVVADDTCLKIEEMVATFVSAGRSSDGWSTLFRDPVTGAFWERSYLQGHLHGGGPPCLVRLTNEQAKVRYPHAV